MSSQARKEKRQKDKLKEAAGAMARVKVLETEYDQHKRLLTEAMDQLVELQSSYNELKAAWYATRSRNELLEAKNGRVERDNEQLRAANGGLRTSLQKLQREERALRKEFYEIKAADKDTAKLRRRLVKCGEEVEKLQLELSRAKRALVDA